MARINNGNFIVFDSNNYTPITLQYGIKNFVASAAIKIYVKINEVSPHINPKWATDIVKNWYAGAAASTQSDSNKPKEVLADE